MEEFFKNWQFTSSALSAIGTILAVIVSIYLAYRATRNQRSQIRASIRRYAIAGAITNSPTYITANITNIGLIPIRIGFSFCHIRRPFKKSGWLMLPLDGFNEDKNIPQKNIHLSLNQCSQKFSVCVLSKVLIRG